MRLLFVLIGCSLLRGQVKPVVLQRTLSDQVHIVRVSPGFATAIRVPEPVSSVVVGDPSKFLVEHSEKEPTLVLVKPVVEDATESNLLVLTTRGRQLSFLLRPSTVVSRPIDFVLIYRTTGSFLVGESDFVGAEVLGTERFRTPGGLPPASALPGSERRHLPPGSTPVDPLTELVDRQCRSPLPALYGTKPPTQSGLGDPIQAGVSEVIDQGRTVLVLFSVVNPQSTAIEILPPQIQLAGKARTGAIVKKDRWTTSEQLPVQDFRLNHRRLGPGERADGVLVFERPSFKQSNESVFLQVAESGAVDKPALAPIGFGVSAIRMEARDAK